MENNIEITPGEGFEFKKVTIPTDKEEKPWEKEVKPEEQVEKLFIETISTTDKERPKIDLFLQVTERDGDVSSLKIVNEKGEELGNSFIFHKKYMGKILKDLSEEIKQWREDAVKRIKEEYSKKPPQKMARSPRDEFIEAGKH